MLPNHEAAEQFITIHISSCTEQALHEQSGLQEDGSSQTTLLYPGALSTQPLQDYNQLESHLL